MPILAPLGRVGLAQQQQLGRSLWVSAASSSRPCAVLGRARRRGEEGAGPGIHECGCSTSCLCHSAFLIKI